MKLHEYLKLLRKRHIGWLVYVFVSGVSDQAYISTLTKEPNQIENDPDLREAEVIEREIYDDPVIDDCHIDIVIAKRDICNG
jgi:hypothetical protein